LVERARLQEQFSEIYAKMCVELGKKTFTWMKPEDAKENKDYIKKIIVNLVRIEFSEGFVNFKKWVQENTEDTTIDQYEKLIRYNKKKEETNGKYKIYSYFR